jgi:hypothetical protein
MRFLQISEETLWHDKADSHHIRPETIGRGFRKAVLKCDTCGLTRFAGQTLPGTTNRAAKRLESLKLVLKILLTNPATNSLELLRSRLLGALTRAGIVFMNLSLAQQLPLVHGRSERVTKPA